jgi:hypothetical protein
MKFSITFFLLSLNVYANDLKIICENENYKYGLSSTSRELYVAQKSVPDSDVFHKNNEHGRVSIDFNHLTHEFKGNGEDGCTMVSYYTQTLSDGRIFLFESLDDEEGKISFKVQCRKLKHELILDNSIYHNDEMEFISHQGSKPFENTLAMNVKLAPIHSLKNQIAKNINKELDCFRGWDPQCEAHVTVITPVEYDNVLSTKLTMKEIESIALRYNIQESTFSIHGIGSANKMIKDQNGNDEYRETYFLILESENLRLIRQMIWYEFVRKGGAINAFDPAWFFPHITIGYIAGDLHESHGVLKNLKYSYDDRFILKK